MDLTTQIIQFVVPPALIFWLWRFPSHSTFGFVAQVAGIGLVFLGATLIAIWALPPWWYPYVLAVAGFLTIGYDLLSNGVAFHSAWPQRRGWLSFAIASLMVAAGGLMSVMAISARALPAGEFVDLAAPFGSGEYLVVNGGSAQIINAHLLTLHPAVPRYRNWQGQSHAVDFVAIGPFGLHKRNPFSTELSSYRVFDMPVLAPCSGSVLAYENGLPDNPVGTVDRVNKPGNHVLLACDGRVIVLAHFRQASVQVAVGDTVETGDQLGVVGNSGESYEPHLHIHAQTPGTGECPYSGMPLPMKIDGRFLVRNDRLKLPE